MIQYRKRSYCIPLVAAKAILYFSPFPQNTVLVKEHQKKVQSPLCYSAGQRNENQSYNDSNFSFQSSCNWMTFSDNRFPFPLLPISSQSQRKRFLSFPEEKLVLQWRQQCTNLCSFLQLASDPRFNVSKKCDRWGRWLFKTLFKIYGLHWTGSGSI